MLGDTMSSSAWHQGHDSVEDSSYDSVASLPQHYDSGKPGLTHTTQRLRSLSLSFPWPRPKPSLLFADNHGLSQHAVGSPIDDTCDAGNHVPAAGERYGPRSNTTGLKGLMRRASVSIKGIVHRRPSAAAEDASRPPRAAPFGRPATSQPGRRLRQATSYGNTRAFYGLDYTHEPLATDERPIHTSYSPKPGIGLGPPIIPENTGAAAKASAAMQNEFLARQNPHNLWLSTSISDDGNDRESGIGIAVTGPELESDNARDDSSQQDISKIDFISHLPTELAIHILAYLDAATITNASLVSRSWKQISSNNHIWRESFLREMTSAYATSQPVQPNRGLGIPAHLPSSNWKEIYRAKQELNHRWKVGKARSVYLGGHSDSIYCVQFDEYVLSALFCTSEGNNLLTSTDTKSLPGPGTRQFVSGICMR